MPPSPPLLLIRDQLARRTRQLTSPFLLSPQSNTPTSTFEVRPCELFRRFTRQSCSSRSFLPFEVVWCVPSLPTHLYPPLHQPPGFTHNRDSWIVVLRAFRSTDTPTSERTPSSRSFRSTSSTSTSFRTHPSCSSRSSLPYVYPLALSLTPHTSRA